MALASILHMNTGDGESSYASNSLLQETGIRKALPFLKQSIKAVADYDVHNGCFTFADFGCSSGTNTLLVASSIIDVVHEVCQENNRKVPQFQVCMNDLFANDFNTIFKLLPDFYAKLKKDKGESFGPCFVSAVPGSYYDRLFPDQSLHLVHAANTNHWLSQVPQGIENNGTNIFMAKTSPSNVFLEYGKQFHTDFTKFLRVRSKEVVPGGSMILSIPSRSIADPTSDDCGAIMELIAQSLVDMSNEGLVRESDIISFNLPVYLPCEEEIRNIIQHEGSFSIENMNFFKVNWDPRGEKVGLVGVNGAGKTTQLRIISGMEEPDSGNVVKAKMNMRISFLSQEFEVSESRTVREEFLHAFKEEMEVRDRLEKVQKAIEGSVDDLELMGRLLDEFDLLQRRAQAVNLDVVDVKINKLMPELGFSVEDADRLVASFSGGWQMRMSLGKILLQDPDLLLLDEPTNHLDLDTIEWLEGYLNKQDVPMVIISHDRAFLDQLCTKIVETDMGVSRTFIGNYSDYIIGKASWIEAQFTAWEKQQKEIEHTRGLISRLGAGANSGRASTAEKKLEKLQDEEQVDKPFIRKQMKIRFPERGRSGRDVVTIKNLGFSYEDKVLFEKANISIGRGEKIAIIGPNGCGKSTLLKLIMGIQSPDNGEVILGEHNVLPNYFEQNQAEALDLEKTVLGTVAEVAEDWRIDDIKGLLGRCNFKADMLERKVSLLSGGEKARLAFCKFMVKPSTLLVLDEPTNHLDIPSKEMLEEAISEYEGTVITVSHDRYFIKQIVNRVLEVKDGNLEDYNGDYDYYLEKNLDAREKALEREAELEDKSPKAKAKSKMSKAEREARKKQKMQAFQQAKQKSKGLKNSKRWN